MRERLFAEPVTRLRNRRGMPRRWKWKLLAVVLALLASWLLSGCGASDEPTNAAGGVVLVIVCVATALAVVFAVRKQRENEEEERSLLLVPGSSLGGGKIVFMPFDEGSHAIRAVMDDLKANQRVIDAACRSRNLGTALDALNFIQRRNAVQIEVLQAVVESRDGAAAEADRSVRGPFAEVPVMLMAAGGWDDGVWGVWALGVIFLAGTGALVWLVVHLRANARFVEELRRSAKETAILCDGDQIKVIMGLEDLREIVNACRAESRVALLFVEAALTTTNLDDYSDALRASHEKLAQVTKTLGDLQRSLESQPEGRSVSCPHPQCDEGWLVCDDPLAERPCPVCGRFFEGKEPS